MTTSERKSSATASVRRNNLTDGFTRLPRILSAPIASATSVGIATAQALAPVCSAININAGTIMPESAHKLGRIISLGLFRPSRISSPMRIKKAKVRMCESIGRWYAYGTDAVRMLISLIRISMSKLRHDNIGTHDPCHRLRWTQS